MFNFHTLAIPESIFNPGQTIPQLARLAAAAGSLFANWLWLIPRLIAVYLQLVGVITWNNVYQQLQPLVKPAPVYAQQPNTNQLLFADDFEQGLDKWQLARGSWDDWQITADGWLEARINHTYTISELVPKDEYWQPGWLNYQLEFDFITYTSADHNWVWGWEDVDNWYEIHFYRNLYHLARVSQGRVVLSHDGLYYLEPNQDYHAKIIFNQGHMQIWINGRQIIDRQDEAYSNNAGRISLKATTGAAYPTHVKFDNIQVYSLEVEQDLELSLTEFKQTDPDWQDEEYNHAESWPSRKNWPLAAQNRTTIRHWGCALSSLASIFKYYELDTLPDGTELNPSSLNTWFKRQPDGYIGEGALNWLAGSRLSRLIRQEHAAADRPLPVLEYYRDYTPSLEEVRNLIDDQRPQILQIPGHFLTAHGYTADKSDLLISDPAYNYTRFSEHQQSLVSSIDFRPSQTDLSYLLTVYEPGLQLDYLNEAGQILTNSVLTQDTLADPFAEELQEAGLPQVFMHSAPINHILSQPETGEYRIRVSANGSQPFLNHIQLLSYDQQAEVKFIDWYLQLESQELLTAVIQFDKTDQTQTHLELAINPDFACFKDILNSSPEMDACLLFRLQETTDWALAAENDFDRQRYQQLLLRFLYFFQSQFPEEWLLMSTECLS